MIHFRRVWQTECLALALAFVDLLSGCGTTIQKIGTEQLLLSDAVDSAINSIDFSSLSGRRIYLDRTFLQTMQTNNVVDANYVVSGLRQQMLAAGCLLQDNRDDAEIIVEPRLERTRFGRARHYLRHSKFVGDWRRGLSGHADPTHASRTLDWAKQCEPGGGKNRRVRLRPGNAPTDLAERQCTRPKHRRSTWVLGIGPLQRGSVYRGVRFAGTTIKANDDKVNQLKPPSNAVTFDSEYNFPQPKADSRVAQLIDTEAKKTPKKDNGS